ncbi:hypothetical protein [Polluticaenibacter yanchengensis]|uniref:DUF4136 domain-containing protein n=1 Tax=Polluticaenibacter yanchengensis TaxID=3014562 RepID=A0ABT4UPR4_9BACT|nr:hypothetical protein [Chitinophagaceae bacterium LY-5]
MKLNYFFVIIFYLNVISCTNEKKDSEDHMILHSKKSFQFGYPNNEKSIEDSLAYYFGLDPVSFEKGDSLIRFFVYGDDSSVLILNLDKQRKNVQVIRFKGEINMVDSIIKCSTIENWSIKKSENWWKTLDSLLLDKKIRGLNGEYYTPSTGGYSVCIQQRFKNNYCYAVVYNPETFINTDEPYNNEDLIKKNVGLIMSFLFKELSIKSKMFENLR